MDKNINPDTETIERICYGCREWYIDVAVETKKEAFELGVFDAGVWLCMEAQPWK